MVLCTINNPGSNVIMVGHSSECVPISVVILLVYSDILVYSIIRKAIFSEFSTLIMILLVI